jgi:hypothetical protein
VTSFLAVGRKCWTVPSRPAHDGDIAEGLVERRRQPLLGEGEPIDEEEAERPPVRGQAIEPNLGLGRSLRGGSRQTERGEMRRERASSSSLARLAPVIPPRW